MKLPRASYVLFLSLATHLSAQPLVDYHQHLFSRASTKLSPGLEIVAATDLIALLDSAKIRRALVLSLAYQFGNPNKPPAENEYEQVKAQNDWTSQQVARFPDRLRGFCGLNPLKEYALEELARCAKDPYLRSGLKLHFGNSDVDLHNAEHVQQLRRVFRAAAENKMAIVIHMRSSVTRKRPYGAAEARLFLDELLPAAQNTPVQIAHLAGAGGYEDPATDEALSVFVDAIASHDKRMTNVYFDASGVAGLGKWEGKSEIIAKRIRQLGVQRILYGSDGSTENTTPEKMWKAFRKLPLTEAEFRTIENNLAPYMR